MPARIELVVAERGGCSIWNGKTRCWVSTRCLRRSEASTRLTTDEGAPDYHLATDGFSVQWPDRRAEREVPTPPGDSAPGAE